MRYTNRVSVCTLLALLFTTPTVALAQSGGAVEGFGGLSLNALQSQPPSLGGTVTFNVVPGIQIVGEAGRMGNVLPTLANTVFSLAQTGLRASALYGEGGVRFLVAPSATVTPYAEATGGVARLDVSSPRLGAVGNAVTSIALGLVGRTTTMAGAGGGILVRGGPIVFDVGYRYKQLFANDVLRTVLGLGQPLRTHQVRAGIGVRF
jgi:opacity protein-like surface antigen